MINGIKLVLMGLYAIASSAMAATTYQFTGVITESYYKSESAFNPTISGEIDKDGWRVGDRVEAAFYYDPIYSLPYATETELTLQIAGDAYTGAWFYGQFKMDNDEVDAIEYRATVEYFGSPTASDSVWIRFEDATGRLFSDNDTPTLPDVLNLDDFTSITMGYGFGGIGPYSILDYYVTAQVVPLPAALWVFISGLLMLSCFRKRTIA